MLNKISKKITELCVNYTEYGYSTYDSAMEVIEEVIPLVRKVLKMKIDENEKIKFLEKSMSLLGGVFDSSLALMDNEADENIRLLEDILIEIRKIYPKCCKREFQRLVSFKYDKLEAVTIHHQRFKDIKKFYKYLNQIYLSNRHNNTDEIEFVFSSSEYPDMDKITINLDLEEYINFKENYYAIDGLETIHNEYITIERFDINKYFNYQQIDFLSLFNEIILYNFHNLNEIFEETSFSQIETQLIEIKHIKNYINPFDIEEINEKLSNKINFREYKYINHLLSEKFQTYIELDLEKFLEFKLLFNSIKKIGTD